MELAHLPGDCIQKGLCSILTLCESMPLTQLQIDLGEEVVYGLGVWFVKTAILAFYLRLSPEKRFRQINYAIMVFVALYSIVSVVMFVVGCIPVAAMWDITLMDNAKCFSQLDLVYGNAACNVLSDLITLILPIRLCWSLHLNRKQKTMLMGLFLLGSLYVPDRKSVV